MSSIAGGRGTVFIVQQERRARVRAYGARRHLDASLRALGEGGATEFQRLVELVGKVVDAGGVAIVVVGVLVATVLSLRMLLRREAGAHEAYRRLLALDPAEVRVPRRRWRHSLGSGYLTFRSVGVLAVIVVSRTSLSFSLELEINGRWPWQEDR